MASVAAPAVALVLTACGGSSGSSSSRSKSQPPATAPAKTASTSAAATSATTTGAAAATTTNSTTTAKAAQVIPVPSFKLPPRSEECIGRAHGDSAKRIPVRVSRVGKDVGILVDVCIGDKGPYPFVVDTGASSVTIDAGLAKQLHIHLVGKPQSYSGAGCTGKEQGGKLGQWSLAGLKLKPQTVSVAKLPHFGGAGQPDGLIGSDVWSRFGAIRIDFTGQNIVVPGPEGPLPTKEILVKKPSKTPLPPTLVHGTPKVVAPMQVDTAKDQTLISAKVAFGSHGGNDFTPDTGASTSLVDTSVARSAGLAKVATRERQNTACSTVTLKEVASGKWSLAGHPLPPQSLLTSHILTSGPAAGLLGADVMDRFGSVVLDYQGGRLVLGAG
jgi:predicted aspartyl protease